ncbi:nSTAND1 domain-containing NTPase [Streptomyces sp. NBC_00391]|uniref:nSTAND1 domain-containing NTPase n=1 Tax=Streptomyces sp. NBC_00391 TaxID=2903647 RepID=UPI002E2076B4
MAEEAGLSASTLSQAAAGDRLPSLVTVRGYALACGADPGEWEARWESAQTEAATAEPQEDVGSAPYRGLARFEPDDSASFFGRDRLADELLQMVRDRRFAVVLGPSGSGKSSLLRAGLIPRLRAHITRRHSPAVLRVLTPGAKPAATYGRLLTLGDDDPEGWVIVDQFEEIFTLCRDSAERTRFIDLLLAAGDRNSRLRVVVAVRADFYTRCAEHPGLAEALRDAGLQVGPMSAEELRQAVIRPAAEAGLIVERALTARIVEEVLGEPGALPLLSHAMLETWRRRRGRILTLAAYEAAGGVRGAIAASAEEVYGRLPDDQACIARQLLLHLIEPGQDGVDTRRPLSRSALEEWPAPETPTVVEQLARARLVTVEEGGVQLAHEALITGWPRLHGWIEEDRERLRDHRRLADATRVWQGADRDPGALYRGVRLARAAELFAHATVGEALSTEERQFLRASLSAAESERRAVTRTAFTARLLVAGLSVVLAVALISGLVAWRLHRDNAQQRTAVQARQVAVIADAMRTTDPRTAMLMSAAAWSLSPLPESRRALLSSLAQPLDDIFTDPAPGDGPDRFLADSGRTLLSVDGRNWRKWDVTTRERAASGRLPDAQVVAASPGARVLALHTGDGVRLWDTATGRWTGASPSHSVNSARLRLGVSGRSYLTSGTETNRVELRSVTDGRVLFGTRAADWTHATVSTDDRELAVCPLGKPPQVWDVVRRDELAGAWEGAGDMCDRRSMLVFAGDAPRLAAVSNTGIRVWDTKSGRAVAHINELGAKAVAFREQGDFLATAGGGELRVWRLSSPDAPIFRHPLNNQEVRDLAWDPHRPVLRYLEGSTVRTLDLAAALTSAWRRNPSSDVRLSPDGRLLATVQRTGRHYRFQLRDTSDGRLLRTLPPLPLPASGVRRHAVEPQHTVPLLTFSPDSTTFAYGVSAPERETAHQRVTVWDLRSQRALTTLDLAPTVPAPGLVSVALGPGGATLYAARRTPAGSRNEAWDTALNRRTTVIAGLNSVNLAVRPDGQLLVGDNRSARLSSGMVLGQDLVQGSRIGALLFSRDGSGLMAGDVTGRVALWDGDLRRRPGVLRNVFPTPLGDTPEGVSALALSPDGCTIAVAGDRGTLQLWDTATLQPVGGPLTTPGDKISTLAFSPDGTTLYAGSVHVPLQRYTVDPTEALDLVCARAGVSLTRREWDVYVPNASYRDVCQPQRDTEATRVASTPDSVDRSG